MPLTGYELACSELEVSARGADKFTVGFVSGDRSVQMQLDRAQLTKLAGLAVAALNETSTNPVEIIPISDRL